MYHSIQHRYSSAFQNSLFTAAAVLTAGFLSSMRLHATDPFQLNTGQLVATADLIIEADLVPDGETIEARSVEVLKGAVPKDFRILAKAIFPREMKEGEKLRDYHSGDDEKTRTILLDEDPAANRRIVFLRQNRLYNLECVQPESKKPQVRDALAMIEDPAPFVRSGKHDEDLDLIFLLGDRFRSFRIEGAADQDAFCKEPGNEVEELKASLVHRLLHDLPWERTRLTIPLTYDPDREPPLLTDGLDAEGAIANFIRKKEVSGDYSGSTFGQGSKLPPRFSVTLDTRGPEKVGNLTRAGAADFLLGRLHSENEEVARAAHNALVKMRDPEAVTAAIGRLPEENLDLPSRTILFLEASRDPQMFEKVAAALDALPGLPDGSHDGGNAMVRHLVQLLPEGPGKLAVLRKAMKKGYVGIQIASSVAETGDEEDFELLLSHLRDPAAVPQVKPLATMVKRSNQKVEEWMEDIGTGESQGQDPLRQRWIAWWEAHKAGFRIVRTGDDALKTN